MHVWKTCNFEVHRCNLCAFSYFNDRSFPLLLSINLKQKRTAWDTPGEHREWEQIRWYLLETAAQKNSVEYMWEEPISSESLLRTTKSPSPSRCWRMSLGPVGWIPDFMIPSTWKTNVCLAFSTDVFPILNLDYHSNIWIICIIPSLKAGLLNMSKEFPQQFCLFSYQDVNDCELLFCWYVHSDGCRHEVLDWKSFDPKNRWACWSVPCIATEIPCCHLYTYMHNLCPNTAFTWLWAYFYPVIWFLQTH